MALAKNVPIFRRTRSLEREIDEYLDKLSESGLLFKIAVQTYLSHGCSPEFIDKRDEVNKMESDADKLRRAIESQLYSQTLIPESRGDVLGLIETLDHLLGMLEGALWAFDIEKPDIPERFRGDYQQLADTVVEAVEELVMSARAFFRDVERVADHNHKVMFYEKEADKVSTKLKRAIFDSDDLELANKSHLRNFVEHIDNVADWSEDVADRLAIYAIKRSI